MEGSFSRNRWSVVSAVVVMLLIVSSASGATFKKKTIAYASDYDGDESGLPVLQYVMPDGYSYVGGNYYSCAAEPKWGGKCVDKVTPVDKAGNPLPPTCAWVDRAAHCGCDPKTLELKGMCSYNIQRNPPRF